MVTFALGSKHSVYFHINCLGYQPQGIDLQTFYRLGTGEHLASKDFDYSVLESKTIYSTVRCHNRAGLFSSKSSDGVKISILPPSITNAKVKTIPLSITEYKAGNNYQSNVNNVKVQWSGFEDYTGIEQFKVKNLWSFNVLTM